MCLIILAYQCHPRYPLMVVANRDEFYERPTRNAVFWPEDPRVLAGRDLQSGGTWLGLQRQGRFAAITNHRSAVVVPPGAASRGLLPLEFLQGERSAAEYSAKIAETGSHYAGFNLLLLDETGLYYCSNVNAEARRLPGGIYGLSNATLDTPWPKVEQGRYDLQQTLVRDHVAPDDLADSVASREIAADDQLPDTGVGLEVERWLSAQFIHSEDYGTRATTSLTVSQEGEVRFLERNFGVGGSLLGEQRETFSLESSPPGPGAGE